MKIVEEGATTLYSTPRFLARPGSAIGVDRYTGMLLVTERRVGVVRRTVLPFIEKAVDTTGRDGMASCYKRIPVPDHAVPLSMDIITSLVRHPTLDAIRPLIEDGGENIRKQLLLLARHQGLPKHWGNMTFLTRQAADAIVNILTGVPWQSQLPIPESRYTHGRNLFNEFITHPLYAGAVIMMLFLAPVSKESEQRICMESYLKEINTMDLEAPPEGRFSFEAFFGLYHVPVHSDIPANPKMAATVHEAIVRWFAWIESTPLYAKISRKLLPTFTRAQLRNYIDEMIEDPDTATPATLEYLWLEHGITLDGPCELKQRWYTNGLKPRSYFAAGPTAYNATKFTQALWNELVDQLSPTNRYNRVTPSRIHTSGKTALFYDLSTFTSSMTIQREFIGALAYAAETEGIMATLRDTRWGTYEVPLHELLVKYNELNYLPEYVWTAQSDEVYRHGLAGFLGVFGNIASCTFLHGALLLQLASLEEECGCAGDDAVICVSDEDKAYVCISLIGVLALEKTFSSSQPDIVYLKRKTWVGDSFHLSQSHYVQFPSVLVFCSADLLSRFRESHLSKKELYDLAASSLGATFRSGGAIDSRYHEDVMEFLRRYYTRCSFSPLGNIPHYHFHPTHENMRCYWDISSFGSYSFVLDTVKALYPGWVRVPDRRERGTDEGICLEPGVLFETSGSPEVRVLDRLGYIERVEKRQVVYDGEDGLDAIVSEFKRKGKAPVRSVYRVIQRPPEYLYGGDFCVVGEYPDVYTVSAAWESEVERRPRYESSEVRLVYVAGKIFADRVLSHRNYHLPFQDRRALNTLGWIFLSSLYDSMG